jgi:hypothetical protein
MARDVSEREFVNYAKGLGSYCTYDETRQAVVAVLVALAVAYPSFVDSLRSLLPAGVSGLLQEAMGEDRSFVRAGDASTFPGRDEYLEILRSSAGLYDSDRPGHLLRAFFGTVKEKSQDLRTTWADSIPSPLREDWDQSITIDQLQDAGQCL